MLSGTDSSLDMPALARTQLELAIIEYVSWFNTDRLHESLDDLPPAEFETLAATDRFRLPSHKMKRGNQQTPSPRNLARLTRGSRSERGALATERLLSAAISCRPQHRSLFAYLAEVTHASTRGQPTPALA